MDILQTTANSDQDLSALAWVDEEVRKSLETAQRALRRHLRDAASLQEDDMDAVDPVVLRTARQHLHQSAGAMDLVGLSAPAKLLRAAEQAVQRFMQKNSRVTAEAVEILERGFFAVQDYTARLLRGRDESGVLLFAQYQAIQQLAAAERVHPADLWEMSWRWVEIAAFPAEPIAQAAAPTRAQFEADMLRLMRGADVQAAATRLSDLCARMAAHLSDTPSRTLWQLASAFYEGLAADRIARDVYSKRLSSRLLAQFGRGQKGEGAVSERLGQDLLFYCVLVRGQPTARIARVLEAYGLRPQPLDYSVARFGRFDPSTLAQLRKRVAAAKDSWSAVAGGDLNRLPSLPDQFGLLGESIKHIYPQGESLATALAGAVMSTVGSGEAPPPGLAMEVATGVLYLEASLDDVDLDNPELGPRMLRLADRLHKVSQGGEPQPLEPWMEELYRRVSDRQTMGSVVAELRGTLAEVEKHMDPFFRDPSDRTVLAPVPQRLNQMRGVLSVLGLDRAALAVVHMRDAIDDLIVSQADPLQFESSGLFDRLADNLGALNFLIDMLAYQPALAKSLFVYEEATGELRPVMGRTPARALPPGPGLPQEVAEPADPAAQVPTQAPAGDDLAAELARIYQDATKLEVPASGPAGLAEQSQGLPEAPGEPGLVAEPSAPAAAPVSEPALQEDAAPDEEDDLLPIFLEEAQEVVSTGREALRELSRAEDDVQQLTTLRRAFHTLKGSSRMVGLSEFGEAAWACEQVLNAWLADQRPATEDLRAFAADALNHLESWARDISRGGGENWRAAPVRAAADAMRLLGRREPIGVLPPAVDMADVSALPAETMPAAFERSDDAGSFNSDAPTVAAELTEPDAPAATDFSFDFNLDLDAGHDAEPGVVQPGATPAATPAEAEEQATAPMIFDLPEPSELEAPHEILLTSWPDAGDGTSEGEISKAAAAAEPIGSGPGAAETQPMVPALSDDLFDAVGVPAAAGHPREASEPVDAPAHETARSASSRAETVSIFGPFDLDLGHHEPDVYLGEPALATMQATPLARLDPHEVPAGPLQVPGSLVEHTKELDARGESVGASDTPFSGAPRVESAPTDPTENLPEEQVKVIGPLRISIPLFNIFLSEADEQSRRLQTELAEWAMELDRPVSETAVALAHSLAGSSSTVGFADLSQLARRLEHSLMKAQAVGRGREADARLFEEAAEQIRALLHQFAAGLLKAPPAALMAALAAYERSAQEALASRRRRDEAEASGLVSVAQDDEQPAADGMRGWLPTSMAPQESSPRRRAEDAPAFEGSGHAPLMLGPTQFQELRELPPEVGHGARRLHLAPDAPDLPIDEDIDEVDQVDVDLFPIFEEEANDLLPQLAREMRHWMSRAGDEQAAHACMRTLHTLKGGARLAGAMRLGELAHRLESMIERLISRGDMAPSDIEPLLGRVDVIQAVFELLQHQDAKAYEATQVSGLAPLAETAPAEPETASPASAQGPDGAPVSGGEATDAEPDRADAAEHQSLPLVSQAVEAPVAKPVSASSGSALVIDWSRFASANHGAEAAAAPTGNMAQAAVRVRTQLLDRLVNQAGEVSMTRARLESEVGVIKGSLADLTDNLERLRQQLRDIELQAETQMSSRMEAAKAASEAFDPLEFDRFTRFQEITRMMAESVNDVATVQRQLQRTLETTEDELAAQARLTRDLQSDLLRTRMVEFEGLSERLYRVVRQAAKETGKQVRLDIVGGSIEVDRGVLDRMTSAFEHLLRNCVTHGIEPADERIAAGKDPSGQITVLLHQEGNEVSVEFRDDGRGLDLQRIRAKAAQAGLVGTDESLDDAAAAALIFTPGFSTAERVTGLAGRGIGMDVVRSEVVAMGGRVETATKAGHGTSFTLVLPLTTAVTQVVLLRVDASIIGVPAGLVEIVRRNTGEEVRRAYASGLYRFGEEDVPFFWLGALLQLSARGVEAGRNLPVLVLRSAQQRVALHVDEVLGHQEVVVKNLGPQLSRLPGLAGMTLLASGAVTLIYNPVALAAVYGHRVAAQAAAMPAAESRVSVVDGAPNAMLAETPLASAAGGDASAAAAPLVLVVDDSLTVRRVTQRLLSREGYRVVLAKDGLEALERLQGERPRVVLSDIEMPRMDGFDLLRNIRSDPAMADLPVIMITSRIAQKHRDYADELGANHYLGKPYGEEELLALVGRYTRAPAAQVAGLH